MVFQTIIIKKTGSKRKFGNYKGVFLIVPIASLTFEKLLKNRTTAHLEQNMNFRLAIGKVKDS